MKRAKNPFLPVTTSNADHKKLTVLIPQKAKRFSCLSIWGIITFTTLSLLCWDQPASAQTFNDIMNALLARDPYTELGCARLVGGSPRDGETERPTEFGPELAAICGAVRPGSGQDLGPNATGGSGGIATTEAAKERLRGNREEDETDANKLELENGVSVWISADAQDLDRNYTKFEDGYDSSMWGVTLATEFKIDESWVAGVAFNYNQWDGNFDSGGSFDTNSYGPILYTTFSSRKNFFAEGLLSYLKRDASNDRLRSYINELGSEVASGKVSADQDENQIGVGLLLGYDYPIRQFSIGPRFALDYAYTDFERYAEKGETGLELEYHADSKVSLQSKLGLQAGMPLSTGLGVLVPQIGVNWVHEYADNQRSISVQFVQDNRAIPATFSFETDKPDRDFFELSAGVSAVLPHNIQTFINYRILAGHDFYDSQAGTVGLRVTF